MTDIAIRCEGLGKQYRIGERERYKALRDTITDTLSAPFRRLRSVRNGAKSAPANGDSTFWALKDISFEVKRGEVVGIIGRNGAGKSTLLKILSRITAPSTGEVEIKGRVGSLLEVGTGFHPELTGRENIYLNGAILGMRKAEIERKFDEIVAFAEIEKFIDTPVKRYSSGMYVRLAFAVAAHLEPEILVIDEVLAVGDAAFQKKCLGKMGEVAESGRTVLFVSHNMASVQRLCDRGLFLEQGELVEVGSIAKVVSSYNATVRTESDGAAKFNYSRRTGLGWARITEIRMLDEQDRAIDAQPCDADLIFELVISLSDAKSKGASLRGLVLELVFCTEEGQPLISLMNVDDGGDGLPEAKECLVRMRLPGPSFIPGRYRMNVFLGIPFLQHVDEISDALSFEVLPPRHPWRPYDLYQHRGVLCRKAVWTSENHENTDLLVMGTI